MDAPIALRAAQRGRALLASNDQLFLGDDEMFKEHVSLATCYGEYGCGQSTRWVAKHTDAEIIAVYTSAEWVERVASEIGDVESIGRTVAITHIDLGPIGDWGMPQTFSKRNNFNQYTDCLWQQSQSPDVVLIDGRFRVCSFLTSVIHAKPGTKLIFDDYLDRPEYHVVEEFLNKSDTCGRQALFEVPKKEILDLERLNLDRERFQLVMS